jgi:hypothetical protein
VTFPKLSVILRPLYEPESNSRDHCCTTILTAQANVNGFNTCSWFAVDFGGYYSNGVSADKLSDCHQFRATARKLPLDCLSGHQTACHSGRPLSDALNFDKKLKEGAGGKGAGCLTFCFRQSPVITN